tara:strand:- start:485 stop:688 length:204 start_codon:yes stop_codon:yes gene_type:complete
VFLLGQAILPSFQNALPATSAKLNDVALLNLAHLMPMKSLFSTSQAAFAIAFMAVFTHTATWTFDAK